MTILVKVLDQENLIEFLKELPTVEAASKGVYIWMTKLSVEADTWHGLIESVNLPTLIQKVQKLKSDVNSVKTELEQEYEDQDPFVSIITVSLCCILQCNETVVS